MEVISQISDRILAVRCSHPVRVGISGITASGKSTFANKLALELKKSGRQIIRASIDSFHNPSKVRYRLGRDSAAGYYSDAHDYESIKNLLLEPLGSGGNLEYCEASLDLVRDVPLARDPKRADADALLVVDGTFLFKAPLRDHWDFSIYLDVDADIARMRGVLRDAKSDDGKDWNLLYLRRYHAACSQYLAEWNPADFADVCVDNNNSHCQR